MPVEIRELIIRATVTDGAAEQESLSGGDDDTPGDDKAIIAACVEQVMKILERQKER